MFKAKIFSILESILIRLQSIEGRLTSIEQLKIYNGNVLFPTKYPYQVDPSPIYISPASTGVKIGDFINNIKTSEVNYSYKNHVSAIDSTNNNGES